MKRLRFLEGIKHIRLAKSASYAVLGALVVLIGTFAAWQFTKIFSPTSLINNTDPVIVFKTSDHNASAQPLPNNMTDGTVPDYTNPGVNPLMIPIISGQVQIPRIQGEVTFR